MVIRKTLGDSASHWLSNSRVAICFCFCVCFSQIYVRGQELAPESVMESSVDESTSVCPENLSPKAPPDPLAYSNDRVKVKVSIAGVAQANGVTGSWWNLSETFAPSAQYKPDRAWGEMWIKPGVTTDLILSESAQLYSGLSYVGSGNIGRDVFEQGNRGLYAVEDGYLGIRVGDREQASQWDISYGRQQYKIGSGMLVSVGAYNGFERGATTSFARRAWEEAGLVKWSKGPLFIDGFYLNPNELRSSDTQTRLAGAKTELALGESQTVGLAYMNVFESTLPYVKAPVQLIPNGREGLNTIHTFNRWNPAKELAPALYFAGDYSTFSGKGRSQTKLTVVALESPRLRIPAFTLRPEFSLDKIGGRIGLQDIDFEDNVSFSQGYVLKSSDEGETRKLFNRALQDFFVQQPPGCCVEAIDGTIVYYNILRSGRINRKPEDYPRLLDEAYRLLRLILDR